MEKSKIEWTDYSWNPVSGCKHGCGYCYANRMASRFSNNARINMTSPLCNGDKEAKLFELDEPFKGAGDRHLAFPFGFHPTLHRYRLSKPTKILVPSTFFVGSTADLFGEWVPDSWIGEVLDVCETANHHDYIMLTKNPARFGQAGIKERLNRGNMWLGTSITNAEDAQRVGTLLGSAPPEAKIIVSIEPLHGPIGFNIADVSAGLDDNMVDWVIIGAETINGRIVKSKAPRREWVADIVEQCRAAKTPVFLKDNLASVWGEPLIQEHPVPSFQKPLGKQSNPLGQLFDELQAYRASDLTPEEAQEFGNAKREGRLMALPCKEGDTVYEIFGGRIRPFCVIGFRKGRMMQENDDYDEVDCDEWCIEYSCGSMSCSTAFSAIGKTVFLTRDEAEVALNTSEEAQEE